MNTDKKIKIPGKIILIKGIVMVLLGIVHTVFCYFEHERVEEYMSAQLAFEFIVWFFGSGVFILFTGVIDILSYKGLLAQQKIAWRMALVSAVFIGFMGLCGILAFRFEPGPPYLLFAAGSGCAGMLYRNRRKYQF